MSIFDTFAAAARKLTGLVNKEVSESEKSSRQFLGREINNWKSSPERREQFSGFMYYEGNHDILQKRRMAIGRGGEMKECKNLPNRKDIDNQYALAVDKKANYFLGRPIDFITENEQYLKLLDEIFNKTQMKKLKSLAKKSMNGGLAWVFLYYDEKGKLNIKIFPAYEIKPYWKDTEHNKLDCAIRLYSVMRYDKARIKYIEKVEIYKLDGVYRYILDGDSLVPDTEEGEYASYINFNGEAMSWEEIPLIPFKYNDAEIPLIRRVKPLQDALNELMSMFHNNMLEDNRSTILVIENYDGQDLGEFRENLSQYGAIKVRSGDGARGGVSTLSVEVNANNYQLILNLLKDAIIENARSYNGKMLNSGTPNQMNILSMYQDIDIDTNEFETEYQASMERLLYFINSHLLLTGQGNYFDVPVKIVFNRDMLMNEQEIMGTLLNAGLKLSNRTLISQVPWIDDVEEELKRIEEEEPTIGDYNDAFLAEGDN